MQPVRPFKNIRRLPERKVRSLEQEGYLTLPVYESCIKSLSDFLDMIPGICNAYGPAGLPCLLLRNSGAQTFDIVPIEVLVNRYFPHKDFRSDAELAEYSRDQKDAASDIIRWIIQQESVDEYIFCADSYYTEPTTGEIGEAILLVHSDSPNSERLTYLPYTYTKGGGFAFGKAECQNSSTGRFNRLRDPRC